MLELERYEWSRLRSARSAVGVPEAITRLQNATSSDTADVAYWKIDNEVIVQGALYEAALPTATCLMQALVHCTEYGRPRIIELLFQLGNGISHPSEIALGIDDLGERCLGEICQGMPLVFDTLENTDPDHIDLVADLLVICSHHDPRLRERTSWYLGRVLEREIGRNSRAAILASLKELDGIAESLSKASGSDQHT